MVWKKGLVSSSAWGPGIWRLNILYLQDQAFWFTFQNLYLGSL